MTLSSVNMLSVVMLNVVMLSVVAPFNRLPGSLHNCTKEVQFYEIILKTDGTG